MLHKTENLLQEASRFWELLIGCISVAISVIFAAILVWLVYLVAWRNPQEYGVHDLFKASTLLIFLLLFAIAFGFSVLAFRLIARRSKRLMSPMLLRIWGMFFAAGSVGILVDCVANKKWTEIWRVWEILIGSISMAIAAFALARKQKRMDEKQTPSNNSPPFCEERVTKNK